MKNKLVSILVCTLLIATVLSVTGINDASQDEREVSFNNEIVSVAASSFGQFDSLSVEISKPEKALYVNDVKMFPLFFTTLILGPITIEADVSGASAEKVEFYIDDVLKHTDYIEPFSWKWDETAFFMHTIKVVAYEDSWGPGVADQEGVIIFNYQPSPPPQLSKEDVIEILMSEIIEPASSAERLSAFLLSQPLKNGDTVTSNSGEEYEINENTWFIFIDDDPAAFYAHETRYVFLDDNDRSYNIVDETWPPYINDASLFDPYNLSRGEFIEIYPILNYSNPISSLGRNRDAPLGDYGDAPDGQYAYHGVMGRFPTLYNTGNSLFGRPGAHTLHVGEETLGVTVSAEVDANDPSDPDGVPNLVDSDEDERSFVILTGGKASIAVTVSVSPTAPDVPRYINILIDFDQSGDWTTGANGQEWAVVNKEIHVDPGKTETIIIPWITWGTSTVLSSPVWMRTALTREKINETLFSSVGGWDGSGQFEYGEIEDQLVFLMDNPPLVDPNWPPWPGNPPGGKDPNPPQPPGPQPPGPSKGPCGADVNYHVIIISGGDCASHMRKGMHPAQEAVGRMSGLTQGQGYNPVANLGPGKGGDNENTLENIGKAFDKLKGQVKCGDHVLIYIVGHGNPANAKAGPGINLKGSDGKTNELLTPQGLANLLGNIPPCPDEDCDTSGKCCHVTVVIESCHAGNFNVPGVTGVGRTVMGSCAADETASATDGGVFSRGFDRASRDPDSDTDGDGTVDPTEAFDGAEDEVNENNRKTGKKQTPWKDSQECECKCPCQPDIEVGKWVWDYEIDEWVDEIEAPVGETVYFAIGILNDGKCRNVTDLEMIDVLPYCLSYGNEAVLYLNGENMGPREPDSIEEEPTGLRLTWDLDEIEEIQPGDDIIIMFTAETVYPGENVNWVYGEARCTYDPNVAVSDEDTATVYVTEECNWMVDQQQTLYSSYYPLYNYMPGHLQSFIPTVSTLDAVSLVLLGDSVTPATIEVALYDVYPEGPAIDPIGLSTMTGVILEETPQWYRFVFEPTITLISGSEYYIATRVTDTPDEVIGWCLEAADPYPNGWLFYCSSDYLLTPMPDYDFAFKTEYCTDQ